MASQLRGPARPALILLGTLLASAASAQVIDTPGSTIYTFNSPGDVEATGLTVGRSQTLVHWIYGMRDNDGDFGLGTIFRIQAAGTGFEVLHSFGDSLVQDAGAHPSGPLVEAADGIFYGTTTGGGLYGSGTLFRLDTTTSPATAITLYSFAPMYLPDEAPHGGVIVSRDSGPGHDVLFGTAGSPGLVYRIDTDGTAGGTLYQPICFTQAGLPHCTFGDGSPDDPGTQPLGVIEGSDGLLYGSLRNGADPDFIHGRIFRMQKDGSDFEVIAAAPGQIVGPPVELERGGNRWIYVAADVGDGTAPNGSIFRAFADGSVRETFHVFDPTLLDVGSPPIGRLLAVPGQNGVYGLTSYGSGACDSGFGCGSVYRAASPVAYPLKVFANNENSRTPLGTPALMPDGRLVVMTGGRFGFSTIYVINHPDTDPLLVNGPASVQTTIATYGAASYELSVANRNGSTRPLTDVQVLVDASGTLQLLSPPAGNDWSCVQPDPAVAQYRCSWSGTLNPGATTPTHPMTFLVSPFGPFTPSCGSVPAPCLTFRADLISGGNVLTFDQVTTAVEVIHPNTGLPNTAPIAGDGFVTVYGLDPTRVDAEPLVYSSRAENDILSFSIVSQPSNGYVSYGGNGSFVYTPYAPLTADDTFEYRVTDTFGASDTGRVRLSPPTSMSVSKSLIDLGQVRAGEMATGRLSVLGPAGRIGNTVFETLTPAQILQVLVDNGLPYDPNLAVSDPGDFRGTNWSVIDPTWIHYRAPVSVGQVSVIRAVFMDDDARVGSVVVVGQSGDPISGQVHAVADQADTAVDTPVAIEVVANDVSTSGQPLYAAIAANCANYVETTFDGAPCEVLSGNLRFDASPGVGDITYYPTAGFLGTTRYSYASGDLPSCYFTGSCRQETSVYWARVTVNVGGATPPNLRATKAIMSQGAPVSSIGAVNGDTVVFRIGAVNEPPAGVPASGPTTSPITVTDALPVGLTFLPAQSDSRCTAAAQMVTCTSTGTLNQGDAVSFDIAATVVATPGPGSAVALYNEAVAATAAELTTADNTSPYVQVMVRGPVDADLRLSIVPSAPSVPAGLPITVTATITNDGPNAASGVTFSGFANLTGFDQVSVTPAADCPMPATGAPLTCTFPFLAANASQTVIVTGRVATPGSFEASGTVSSVESDPNPANNTATATVAVHAFLPSDIRIDSYSLFEAWDDGTAQESPWNLYVGLVASRLDLTLAVNHREDFPATLRFRLPGGFLVQDSRCSMTGQDVACALGLAALPAGEGVWRVQFVIWGPDATLPPGETAVPYDFPLSVELPYDPTPPDNTTLIRTVLKRIPGQTPLGSQVAVPLLDASTGGPLPVTVTFSTVTRPGETSAVVVTGAPQLPDGFAVAGATYDIATTASYTPPVTVCIDGSFGASDYLLHYEGGAWVQLPNQQRLPVGGPPFSRVCADTTSFSPFVVATRVNRGPTADAGVDQLLEATGPSGAAVTVAASGSDPDADPLSFEWSGGCGQAAGPTATLACPLGTSTVTLTVRDGGGGVASDTLSVTVRDTTPPRVTCGAADTVWHADNVAVTCTATDVVDPSVSAVTLSTSVPAGTETSAASTGSAQVCDAAGNCATAGPVGPFRIDRRGPAVTVTRPAANAVYTLNQAVTVTFTCTDGGAGTSSCTGTLANGATLPTTTAGTYTFTVDAVDAVGNATHATVSYTVRAQTFTFTGFFSPVDNAPVVNRVKAGSAVPVKFSLGGDYGLSVFAPGFPRLDGVACGTGTLTDDVEELVMAGRRGLQYDPVSQRYTFVWKTDRSMAGACWQLTLRFTDGTGATALFELRR